MSDFPFTLPVSAAKKRTYKIIMRKYTYKGILCTRDINNAEMLYRYLISKDNNGTVESVYNDLRGTQRIVYIVISKLPSDDKNIGTVREI